MGAVQLRGGGGGGVRARFWRGWRRSGVRKLGAIVGVQWWAVAVVESRRWDDGRWRR